MFRNRVTLPIVAANNLENGFFLLLHQSRGVLELGPRLNCFQLYILFPAAFQHLSLTCINGICGICDLIYLISEGLQPSRATWVFSPKWALSWRVLQWKLAMCSCGTPCKIGGPLTPSQVEVLE